MRKTGLSGLMLINLSFASCSRATKLYTEVDGYRGNVYNFKSLSCQIQKICPIATNRE